MDKPEMQALAAQDIEDLTALQVSKTPTFFVNGRSLPSFGRTSSPPWWPKKWPRRSDRPMAAAVLTAHRRPCSGR